MEKLKAIGFVAIFLSQTGFFNAGFMQKAKGPAPSSCGSFSVYYRCNGTEIASGGPLTSHSNCISWCESNGATCCHWRDGAYCKATDGSRYTGEGIGSVYKATNCTP